MSKFETFDDDDDVIITIHAPPAETPARPILNGVPRFIPNNAPTAVPVRYARLIEAAGYSFSAEPIPSEDEQDEDDGTEEGDPVELNPNVNDQIAPPVLGGDGAGDGAQPQGTAAAVPIPAAPAFNPTPVLDGNAATTIARLADLSLDQLATTRLAEVADKNRKTVIEAIDARLAS